MHDLIIIGGGPAAVSAAVYAGRKRLKTLLIAKEFGGQSIVSPDIQNWIGDISVSGEDLAERFKKHVETYAGDVVTIQEGLYATDIKKIDGGFSVITDNQSFSTKTVLIATGATRRKLQVPGAEEFENKGITYCASCDGPLFADKNVIVIGGGNAGFETAAQLLAYAKHVTLLQRSEAFRADEITVNKVLSHPNMTGILNAETQEIAGDTFVKELIYKDAKTGEIHTLATEGVFVEIGLIPATDVASNVVDRDEYKRIIIDPWTQKTSTEGIWAAGDCSNIKYHQNNIAAGDGVRALEDIYTFLHTK